MFKNIYFLKKIVGQGLILSIWNWLDCEERVLPGWLEEKGFIIIIANIFFLGQSIKESSFWIKAAYLMKNSNIKYF